ncbi:hypothetical protein [Brevundimonas sp. SL161]|uniref:hypothetical protein n=1 Tax=Brevundimonas sp. SL161 TaxID=2804613 RepID=UPI003CF255C3
MGEGAKRVTTWGEEAVGMGEGSERAALIPPDAAKPSLSARLRAWAWDEVLAQSMRWRLWAPVAFGGGAAVYFALRQEPPLWPPAVAAVSATGVWLGAKLLRRGRALPCR